MAELLPVSKRKKFFVWIGFYGFLIWIATGKGGHGGEDFQFLFWGMILGLGAALAVCEVRIDGLLKRLGVVIIWALSSTAVAFLLLRHGMGAERSLESSSITTAIFGFPALLALIPWLLKNPKHLLKADS